MLGIASDASLGRLPREKVENVVPRLARFASEGRLALCGLGNHSRPEALQIAAEIAEEDPDLGQTDVLIVASAFACDECEFLLTNDRLILQSRYILRKGRALGVRVTEAQGA